MTTYTDAIDGLKAERFSYFFDAARQLHVLDWERHGRYETNDDGLRQALHMERDGLLARVAEVYDGERDVAEQLRRFDALPDEMLAIAVADFTFTR